MQAAILVPLRNACSFDAGMRIPTESLWIYASMLVIYGVVTV